MSETYQLYGMPASLYMAKARSYMRKQQIPFVERVVSEPHFGATIVPQLGRMIMPVLECADGSLVQDGADIIDFFEQQAADTGTKTRLPAYPETALQRVVSELFALFGGEGLLRPAMHYRWNFDDCNLEFLKEDFAVALAPAGAGREVTDATFDMASGRMRSAAASFGVTPESMPLVESSYAEFLALFSAHLKTSPYLLGGRPTIGDYGLIAPLYAHLARDPYPAQLMRQTAPAVSRWVERMNSAEQIISGYAYDSEALFADDTVPETLKELLRYIAAEYLAEITAHVDFANQWLADQPDLQTGSNGLKNPGKRFIGMAEFDWRGIRLKTTVMPYRFYLLQRVQDCFAAASKDEQRAIEELFSETGLSAILSLKTNRRVERENHLEVWGAEL